MIIHWLGQSPPPPHQEDKKKFSWILWLQHEWFVFLIGPGWRLLVKKILMNPLAPTWMVCVFNWTGVEISQISIYAWVELNNSNPQPKKNIYIIKESFTQTVLVKMVMLEPLPRLLTTHMGHIYLLPLILCSYSSKQKHGIFRPGIAHPGASWSDFMFTSSIYSDFQNHFPEIWRSWLVLITPSRDL